MNELTPREPFFSRRDKLAFALATGACFAGYSYTVAPSVTLEDSGEFLTAAYHLGVPHPPGYPIWTILAWLWQLVFPFGNIAWRVNMLSVIFGSLATGLAALLISKTGHVMGERVGFLKELGDKWIVDTIVLASAVSASLLICFTPVMWSQSVISEVYGLNAFFLFLTLVLLYRWSFEPERRWRLYLAAFIWGVSLTNHQTLVLLTVAFPTFVWFSDRKLGRDALIPIITVVVFLAIKQLGSTLGDIDKIEQARQQAMAAGRAAGPSPWEQYAFPMLVFALLAAGLGWWLYHLLFRERGELFHRWRAVLLLYGAVILGLSLYMYMHLSSETNPPMNWGYTRTWQGFMHHFTRGQYEKVHLERDFVKCWGQLNMFFDDLQSQFSIVFALLALLALFFFRDLDRRDKDWLKFLFIAFLWLGLGFLFLSNPGFEKQKQFTDRVFFLPGHCIYALFIGYGLILAWGYVTLRRTRLHWPALVAFAIGAVALVLYFNKGRPPSLVAGLVCIVFGLVLLLADFLLQRQQRHAAAIALAGALLLLPTVSIARNWADNEQRHHYFGYMFGYLMFKPGGGYPEMDRDAVLYGGTDPGRFVPTYMIFVESLAPSRAKTHMPQFPESGTFNRSDVYIITQNALADSTYMSYVRDHYAYERPRNDSAVQRLLGRDRAYPREPIWVPSELDSQAAFSQYVNDLRGRQPMPDEQVEVEGGRVQVTGVGGVMAINGILTKMIFDKNKDKHSFYVEESYVIPWMYPYMEPYGIILKINKEPVPQITPEMITRDRNYWDQLFQSLKADPKFHRDDVAQKTFSKLRSAIGGLYAARGLFAEAEYAYKQAIVLCPDSPEGNFRLAQLYVQLGRFDDALNILREYQKGDPHNVKIAEVLKSIEDMKKAAATESNIEQQYAQDPNNVALGLQLVDVYARRQRWDAAQNLAQTLMARPDLNAEQFLQLAQRFAEGRQLDRVLAVLSLMTQRHPQNPLGWYNLAVILAMAKNDCEASVNALERALAVEPDGGQFHQLARTDNRFANCRKLPRFQSLVGQGTNPATASPFQIN